MAVIDGVVLYLMGIPGAFVWAVLAFVTNFIPNIGFIIGVIPPAFIALLDSGAEKMVAVIVVYSVINFVIQSVIQPRVVGDAVGLLAHPHDAVRWCSGPGSSDRSALSWRCRSPCSHGRCWSRPTRAPAGPCR